MKKLFIILFALIICLSGCGWNIKIVDPTEQTSDIEKTEPEEKEEPGEITEEFIEEIVLNFGAEKEADGTYRVTEPFSFYRDTGDYEDFQVIDDSANSLYGMGAMLGKEYIKEIYVSDLKYDVYEAETFENMVYKYFGISADILKNTIHYNEFEELGVAGYYWLDGPYFIEEDPSVKLEGFEKIGDNLIINLKTDYEKEADISGVLTVKLLPDGGYNYISYFAEKIEGTEPERITSMTFKLGSKGEAIELSPNDSIGEWVLTKLDVDYNPEIDWTDSIEAEFSGTVELKGHIERDPMSWYAYDFVIDRSEFDRMPWLVHKDFKEFRGWFILNIPEGLENSPKLDFGETLPCKITIANYRISCAYTETADGADVIKIEPLTEEIPALYEEIILNFGAVKKEDGTFISDKTGGFLFENVFEDASKLETKYYFFWATEKFIQNYNGDLAQFESPHGIGYSFPAEEFEEIIGTYFDAAPEKLREDGIFYCSEHNAYCSPGATGFGAQYDIEILSYTKNDKELSIRLLVGNNVNCLKVLLTENGGYRFLSYLPE